MNRLLLPLFSIVLFSACNKEADDEITINNYDYEATVIGKGLDCGETFTISLKSIKTSTTIEAGTYYADSLDEDLKIDGQKIYLNCREPNKDELYPCTAIGPTYSHVIVTESEKQD